jgi:hypothetical protein
MFSGWFTLSPIIIRPLLDFSNFLNLLLLFVLG